MRDEFLVAAKEDAPASRDIRVGLSLLGLPLGRPEPSLVGVDRALDDPAQKYTRALDCVVGQLIDQLVKVSLGHDSNSDTAPGSRAVDSPPRVGDRNLGFDPRHVL